MCDWIHSLYASGICTGVANSFCDLTLSNDQDIDPGGTSSYRPSITPAKLHDIEKYAELDKQAKRFVKRTKVNTETLNAIQTVAYSVLVSGIICVVFIGWVLADHEGYKLMTMNKSYLFPKRYGAEFFMCMISGIFSFFQYYYSVKTLMNASSTIVYPLLKAPAMLFMLLVSHNFLGNFLGTVIVGFGGLLPAVEGNVLRMFKVEFWKSKLIKYALYSEINHLALSSRLIFPHNNFFQMLELFFLTKVLYIATFIFWVMFSPKLRTEIRNMVHVVPVQHCFTAMIEILTALGYFSSIIARQCNVNTAELDGIESFVMQICNIGVAYALRRFYGLGKEDSRKNLGLKLLSSVLITLGILLPIVFD